MQVIIACTGSYAGLFDCIKSFKARANCPVHVIADKGVVPDAEASYSDFQLGETGAKLLRWHHTWTIRWLVIGEFMRRLGIDEPCYCPDWDNMCFRDLNVACAPFLQFDVAATRNVGTDWAAHLMISKREIVERLAPYVKNMVDGLSDSDPVNNYNDMALWSWFIRDTGLTRGDMSAVINGSTFDHNMHCGVDTYEASYDGPQVVTKRIFWMNGVPYFLLRKTEELVAVNIIHCWGSYKSRTSELAERAGIT